VMFDVRGNLYVCANQANEVQVLDPSGQLIARYKGTGANAFDFPASLVFHERALYVTNLSLSDSGVNSRLSVLGVPFPGLPLRPSCCAINQLGQFDQAAPDQSRSRPASRLRAARSAIHAGRRPVLFPRQAAWRTSSSPTTRPSLSRIMRSVRPARSRSWVTI